MEYKLRRLDRQLASDGKVLSFYRDTMELPDGKIEQWDYVHHKRGGGACVVPVLNDGRILMVHQYRPALDRESIELRSARLRLPERSDQRRRPLSDSRQRAWRRTWKRSAGRSSTKLRRSAWKPSLSKSSSE